MGKSKPNPPDAGDYLEYSETSPSGLRWAVDVRSGMGGKIIKARAGDVAGSLTKEGYYRVSINNKSYMVHRIIYELEVGPIPDGLVVNHVDQNKTNNLVGNLEAITQHANCQNQRKSVANISGFSGVSRGKDRSGTEYWVANWTTENKERKGRWFRISAYGEDGAKAAAIACRAEGIAAANANGAKYTSLHGADYGNS